MSVNLQNRSLSQGVNLKLYTWNGEKSCRSIQLLANQSRSVPTGGGTVLLRLSSGPANVPWFSGPVPTNTPAPVSVDPERQEVSYAGRVLPSATDTPKKRLCGRKMLAFGAATLLLGFILVTLYRRRHRRGR